MFVKHEGFFLFESFANESQSQDGYLLDEDIFVTDVGADFFDDSFPLIPGDFDTTDCGYDVGCGPSDISVMIDQYRQDSVLDTLFGLRLQVIPQECFGLGLGK